MTDRTRDLGRDGRPRGVEPSLSVVIPVLNDASALERLLRGLAAHAGPSLEIIVVDGGSTDHSRALAAELAGLVITAGAGRGRQLAAGARASRGRWLWFLHADSNGVDAAADFLLGLSASPEAVPGWGRFDVAFDQPTRLLRLVAAAMALRSRMTGICTGDQGIFVHRQLLDLVGGVPPQPLMEDIELSLRLRRLGRPVCRREVLTTSARRWHAQGVVRTILKMWGFRLRYWFGADPDALARRYYR